MSTAAARRPRGRTGGSFVLHVLLVTGVACARAAAGESPREASDEDRPRLIAPSPLADSRPLDLQLADLALGDAWLAEPGRAAAELSLDPRLAEPVPARAGVVTGSPFLVDVTAFYESIELDEVTEELLVADFSTGDSAIIGEFDIEDVERRRAGVNVRFGLEEVAGEISIFGEKLEPFDTFRLVGTSLGVVGTPRVHSWGETALIFDYGVTLGLEVGDGDVLFADSMGNTFEVDGDIVYLSEQLRFGAGVDVAGLQVTAGVLADFFQGEIDVDVDDDFEIDGDNVGGYVSVGYRGADAPVFARVRGYFGDYEGVAVELGVRF